MDSTPQPEPEVVIEQLLHKATQALDSAQSEFQADRLDFAVNRAYYACFYAASAVMLQQGKQFVKHAGLRSAIHRDLSKLDSWLPNGEKFLTARLRTVRQQTT